jgi:hypothetical protein
MLQAIEAEISPDGKVTLLEPVHLAQRSRAVVTILAPIDETAPTQVGIVELNRVLADLHAPAVTNEDIAPLRAA